MYCCTWWFQEIYSIGLYPFHCIDLSDYAPGVRQKILTQKIGSSNLTVLLAETAVCKAVCKLYYLQRQLFVKFFFNNILVRYEVKTYGLNLP